MHIGELAARTALSSRTIRHYGDVGLLHPSARTDGGFRIYSEQDYQRLVLIQQARTLGFSLEDIAWMVETLTSCSGGASGHRDEELEWILQETTLRRQALASNLGRADAFIAVINDRMAR